MNITCKAEILKTAIEALRALVSETRMGFSDGGMHAGAVDSSNVAMVFVEILPNSFKSYDVDKETTIGVDIAKIGGIIKPIKKDELIDIICEDNRIRIQSGNLIYTLATIDPSAIRRDPKVPDLDLPAKIAFDARELKKSVLAAKKISDFIIFRSDESGFHIEANGDYDRLTFHLSESELTEFNRAQAKSMFSIEYLEGFTKVASSGNLTIHLGDDYPARLQFELVDGNVAVEYILAPRIEVEE
jgi:proliferating cell nuclear antigen